MMFFSVKAEHNPAIHQNRIYTLACQQTSTIPYKRKNKTNMSFCDIHNCFHTNPYPDKTATGKTILLKHKNIPKKKIIRTWNLKILLPNNQRKRQILGKIIHCLVGASNVLNSRPQNLSRISIIQGMSDTGKIP